LNDIWPGTSWSSIDYFGRYKALQYAAKRFFAPILLSCEEIGELQIFGSVNAERGSVSEEYGARLCVTNDTRSSVKGTVRWELRDKDSGMIGFGESEVEVDPMSAKYVTSIKFDNLDVTGDHLYFELSVDGKTVSDGSVLFCAPKHYAFEDPKLCLKVDGDEIIVRSEAFAMAVRIENKSGDLVLSDNYFSMEAGEKRVRVLSGDTVGLAVSSVYDIG
jgi:beta-mannosidase